MALPLPNAWTDDEIATLLKLWDAGQSAGEIALVLGRTRNAIVGRIHREREKLRAEKGWAAATTLSRAEKAPRAKTPRREALAKPRAARPPKPRSVPVSVATPRAMIFTAPIELIGVGPFRAPIEEPPIEEPPIEEVAIEEVAIEEVAIEETVLVDPAPASAPEEPAADLPPLPPLYFGDEWKAGRCRAPLFADKVDPEAPVFCGARCEITEAFCTAHQRRFYLVPVRPKQGREPILPAPRGRR